MEAGAVFLDINDGIEWNASDDLRRFADQRPLNFQRIDRRGLAQANLLLQAG